MEKYMGHCFQVLGGNDEQINHTKTDLCSICELVCVSVCERERFSENPEKFYHCDSKKATDLRLILRQSGLCW